MGLSIHYSGRIKAGVSLQAMIEEVKEIVEAYQWRYTIYEDVFPANSVGKTTYNQHIYGINFIPPECEPVFLCFLSNGKMSSAAHLRFFGHSTNKEKMKYLYMLSTKTQYAGADIHMLIIHLLKYISIKYLQDFRVFDEGSYWEIGDEVLLKDTFERYRAFINNFSDSIQNYPMMPGESFEMYFERLLKKIQKKHAK